MKEKHEWTMFGSGGHKAVFDVAVTFKSEMAPDDHAAHEMVEALADYIRSKAPNASDLQVSVSQR